MASPQIVGFGAFRADSENPYAAITWLERGASVLRFNPRPPDDLRAFTLAHDLIVVGGGNTANMLAVWRVHGFDSILREAWESGIVLTGWSAGMICWFEAGVTDSFGPELAGMRDGLGFLPGSACPHYDGEDLRRPVYRRLVAEEGFPSGIAADDAAGARDRGGRPRLPRHARGRGAARGPRRLARNSASQATARRPIQIGVRST